MGRGDVEGGARLKTAGEVKANVATSSEGSSANLGPSSEDAKGESTEKRRVGWEKPSAAIRWGHLEETEREDGRV